MAMAPTFNYYQILLLFLFLLALYLLRIKRQTKGSIPTNWPIVGMIPGVLPNLHRMHDFITQVLNETGGTFEFKGPPLANLDMVFTCDPANINHIFSKRFSNYPKGPYFQKIYEILGSNIFNSDFQLWEVHRRATLSLMNDDHHFYLNLEKTTMHKLRTGLLPILDKFFQNGAVFDMQDILQRFAFDNICQFFLNHDPMSLQPHLPNVPCEKALSDALEPLFFRHLLPEPVWKLQKWFNIGKEKTLTESWQALDQFIYQHITPDSEELHIFKSFNMAYEASSELGYSGDLRRFMRDTFLGLLFAGRDSLSVSLTWLFLMISTNPSVETKIREEIKNVLGVDEEEETPRFFSVEECDRLVYLHAALCETLRLFPPIGLELKSPAEQDVLPSGNSVRTNSKIVVSFYSTGRMESVWGKDCMEFKPERWISPAGKMKHESSFKFPAFNVGPRTCPGKKMAFIEMKLVAAFIVLRFSVEVVDSETVCPRNAIMLKADHGLMVRLSRKNGL